MRRDLIKRKSLVQKQQETLIVWSEGDNFDLALSFQEKVVNNKNITKYISVACLHTAAFTGGL